METAGASGARQTELVIVGGGASGTAMLQALAARLPARPVEHLVLFERGDTLGPGLPYTEASDPHHTMGRTRTLRRDKGRQLEKRFAEAFGALASAGVRVELRTGTEVHGLTPIAGGVRVESDRGTVESPHVVLATGHWHVERLAHLERTVDWRWDVRRLHAAIRDDEDVIILGAQQSGMDVATSLAARRRGRLGVGRIRLVSRLGVLPGVFGHVGGKQVATLAIEALLPSSSVRLIELFDAVAEGARAVAGRRVPFTRWNPNQLREALADVDGTALLRREVRAASRAHTRARPIPWHPVLWHGLACFHALMPRLPAEDRLELAAHWTPILRHVEAIHPSAAAHVLSLLESGLVELHGLGEDLRIEEDAGGVRVTGSRGSVRGTRIVDARGPDPRLPWASEQGPIQELLQRGDLAEGRAAFLHAPPASPPPSPLRFERMGGRDWLITGGIWVDPTSFTALDATGRHGPFSALGPLTVGQFPFYAGLWATREAATRIVESRFPRPLGTPIG